MKKRIGRSNEKAEQNSGLRYWRDGVPNTLRCAGVDPRDGVADRAHGVRQRHINPTTTLPDPRDTLSDRGAVRRCAA